MTEAKTSLHVRSNSVVSFFMPTSELRFTRIFTWIIAQITLAR